MARRGTAASRCPACEERRRAGRRRAGTHPGSPHTSLPCPALPHRGGGRTRTTALAGRDFQQRRLRSPQAPRRSPGVSSPPDRAAPPACPAAFPGLTASESAELRTGPSANGGSAAPSGAAVYRRCTHRNHHGERAGGSAAPRPGKASGSPSKAGHAGQTGPAPNFGSQRIKTSRSRGAAFPALPRRPCPAPTPDRPRTPLLPPQQVHPPGRASGTWDSRRAKRSLAVLKDARRAETAGPADSASSSSSGCRPCPPASLRGRSPGGLRDSVVPGQRRAATPPRCPTESLCRAAWGRRHGAGRCLRGAGPGSSAPRRAEPRCLGPRPLPLPPSCGVEPRAQRQPRRGRDTGSGASRLCH